MVRLLYACPAGQATARSVAQSRQQKQMWGILVAFAQNDEARLHAFDA
jgi:hypothetical protein